MKPITWTNTQCKLSQLKEWDKNPVRISGDDLKHLAESVKKFRGVLPYVAAGPMVKGSYPLLDGHQRKRAELEVNKVAPDLLVDVRVPSRKLTAKERSEIVIRLRKNQGEFDDKLLLENFKDFPMIEFGFSEKELKDFGFDPPESKDAEPEIDRAAELLKKWKVKTGDLFAIGDHRLICGDCTDAAVVARVMGGRRRE